VDDVMTEVQLTVPQVARRLGLPGGEIYRLIFAGALIGCPGPDGAVYVSERDLEAYVARATRSPAD
jgi:hypothetical protein